MDFSFKINKGGIISKIIAILYFADIERRENITNTKYNWKGDYGFDFLNKTCLIELNKSKNIYELKARKQILLLLLEVDKILGKDKITSSIDTLNGARVYKFKLNNLNIYTGTLQTGKYGLSFHPGTNYEDLIMKDKNALDIIFRIVTIGFRILN